MRAAREVGSPVGNADAVLTHGRVLRVNWIVAGVLLALALVVFCRTAWLSDDSYITFRTIDNFVHGYGLRWNVDERVQAYTHPLWLAVMLVGRLVTGEVYWTALILGVACSMAALLLFIRAARGRTGAMLFGVVAFLSSRAFVDFSSSGLENAVSHLLLAGFLFEFWTGNAIGRTKRLAIWSGLILLNRLDLALLIGPAFVAEWVASREGRWTALVWLIGPLCAWEVFSVFYYGFPFPNTAYAKLHTGISVADLLPQGLLYFSNSLHRDAATLLVIAAGTAVTLARRRTRDAPVLAGVGAYLAYVLWIGGDFMSGRFFAAPLLVSVWLLTVAIESPLPVWLPSLASALLLAVSLAGPYTAPFLSGRTYGLADQMFDSSLEDHGINDERRFYFQQTGMLRANRRRGVPIDHPWFQAGRQAGLTGVAVVVRGNVGFYGYAAGPATHIIDYYALGDPLLARLPAKKKWRIGHFVRIMPVDYPATVQSSRNQIADPDLAAYYDHLHLIASGPLWNRNRLWAIARMNLGRDEPLVKRYVARLVAEGYE